MEEKGPLGGFALNLLGDMERLSLGSAAGTESIVLEERLFGRAMEDTPGGGVTAFPWLCGSSHAKTHHSERRGGRKIKRGRKYILLSKPPTSKLSS